MFTLFDVKRMTFCFILELQIQSNMIMFRKILTKI